MKPLPYLPSKLILLPTGPGPESETQKMYITNHTDFVSLSHDNAMYLSSNPVILDQCTEKKMAM